MEISPDMDSHYYCTNVQCIASLPPGMCSLLTDASLALLARHLPRCSIPCLGLDIAPLLHDDVAGN